MPAPEALGVPGGGRDLRGTEVLLVVEDEKALRTAIARTLRGLGYYILEASNGEEALHVMQDYHSPVHLVVTDIVMPEMEGTELVGLLRDWYPQMRALFISGYGAEDVEVGTDAVEGSAFLGKPFSLEALATKVRDLLDQEWSPASSG